MKQFFDKNGKEIHDGDYIKITPNDIIRKVYVCVDDDGNESLGTDATNPKWIESGRAVPCEYGIYPLDSEDLSECVICNTNK